MRLILCFLTLAIALSPEFPNPLISKLRLSDILIAFLILFLLGHLAFSKREFRFPRQLALPLGIIFVLNFLSFLRGALIGTLMYDSLIRGIYYLGKRVEYFVLFVLTSNAVEGEDDLKLVIYSTLFASFLAALFAIAQFRFTGERATGTIEGQPNILGAYLLLHIALAISILSFIESRRTRLFLVLFFFIGIFAILYTLSRGTFVSFVFLLFFALFFKPSRKTGLVFLILLSLLVTIPMLNQKVKERIASIPREIKQTFEGQITRYGASAFYDRYAGVISGSNFARIAQYPWLGYGMGYLPLGWLDIWVFTELTYNGILGTIAFLWLIFIIFRRLYRIYDSEVENVLRRSTALGLMLALFSFLIFSLSADIFYIIRPMEAFWLILGAVEASEGRERTI